MPHDDTATPTTPIALDAYEQLADAYAERVDTKPHNAYLERPATLGLLPDVAGWSTEKTRWPSGRSRRRNWRRTSCSSPTITSRPTR